ncbi:hypothetical protein ACIPSE_36930 [Streptomyces sp. NPDC090106]|uniref:hypothetical protein n=1 Tax=Streptomyces sp. NPDC090106 TaxID=3365946 RepID=UPI0037F44FE6
MSITEWALVVAAFAAFGTVMNMLASWATYRRATPSVEMRLHAHIEQREDSDVVVCGIRFISKSLTPFSIERIEMVERFPESRDITFRYLPIIAGDEGGLVPPKNSLIWATFIRREMFAGIGAKRVNIRAYLSNGTIVHLDRKNELLLASRLELLQNKLASVELGGIGYSADRQLTFDDI